MVKISENNEMTTIAVKTVTRSRLTDICRKDQSYDELINILIDSFKK